MLTYEKFKELGIDLTSFGLEVRESRSDYLCTPEGSRVLFWTGVDGVHYITIKNQGERIFVVSPMEVPGAYVMPVAENFEDFVRLLLVSGGEALLSQLSYMSKAEYDCYLEEFPLEPEQEALKTVVKAVTGLTPMEDAFSYVKKLQSSFDYSTLKFSKEYYDNLPYEFTGEEAPQRPDWKVYYHGDFFSHEGRERAGKEIPLSCEFSWADMDWKIPVVYSCTSGIVIDLIAEITDPEEKALSMMFDVDGLVNGKKISMESGRGICWRPDVLDPWFNSDGRWTAEHYGLSLDQKWGIRRLYFPWPGKKETIKSLELTLKAEETSFDGEEFTVTEPGSPIILRHPETEEVYTLIPAELTEEDVDEIPDSSMEYPTKCRVMNYTVEPDPGCSRLRIVDSRESDAPRKKTMEEQKALSSHDEAIMLIGGVDGPVSMAVIGRPENEKGKLAYSSLYFELPEEIRWKPVFYEKMVADITIPLS